MGIFKKFNSLHYDNPVLNWLTAITGFTFWFIIGFPFEHSYESFPWMTQYFSRNFIDFIFQPVGHYISYRPLGQIFCTVLFELSNRSLVLIQIFNFAATIFSVYLLLKSTENKKTFSLIFLICGGVFFQAYTYLFHLNGLFYSGILFQIAYLIYYSKKSITSENLITVFFVSVVLSLINPFSIYVYLSYTAGMFFEYRQCLSRSQKILISSFLLIAFGISFLLVPGQRFYLSSLPSLAKIYAGIESNILVKIFVVLLQGFALSYLSLNSKLKTILLAAFLLLTTVFYYLHIPLLFLLMTVLILKLLTEKRLTLMFISLVLFFFTIFTGPQPNHMKIYFIFTLSFILSLRAEKSEMFLRKKIILAFAISAFILITAMLVRAGSEIPVLKNYTSIILTKKEQTYQLNEFINWYINSDYKCSQFDFSFNSEEQDKVPADIKDLQAYINRITNCYGSKGNRLTFKFVNNIDKLNLIWFQRGKYTNLICFTE